MPEAAKRLGLTRSGVAANYGLLDVEKVRSRVLVKAEKVEFLWILEFLTHIPLHFRRTGDRLPRLLVEVEHAALAVALNAHGDSDHCPVSRIRIQDRLLSRSRTQRSQLAMWDSRRFNNPLLIFRSQLSVVTVHDR